MGIKQDERQQIGFFGKLIINVANVMGCFLQKNKAQFDRIHQAMDITKWKRI